MSKFQRMSCTSSHKQYDLTCCHDCCHQTVLDPQRLSAKKGQLVRGIRVTLTKAERVVGKPVSVQQVCKEHVVVVGALHQRPAHSGQWRRSPP
eukprot:303980-Chlamydomonas_euryale.AAC.27